MVAVEREASKGQPLPAPVVVDIPVIEKPSIGTLFSRGLAMRTIIGCLIMITLNTAIYGFIAFLPTFMVKQGINIVTSLNYTTLMSFGGPCGALVGMWLGDRIGRKSCIIWFSLAAIAFGALYPQTTDPNLLMLVGFMLVSSVYVLVAIAFGLYVPELFPTEVRMRGAGFCNTAGRLMTILTPQLTVPLFAAFGVAGVISMVGGLLVVQVIVVALFGIETRKKALEALVPRGVAGQAGLAPGSASADAV
jgi:putative MFS transporter